MVRGMSCGFCLLFFLKPQPNSKYKTSMCRDLRQQGGCPRGTNCTFAHSQEELEKWVWETFSFYFFFPPFDLNPSNLQRFLKTFSSMHSFVWKDLWLSWSDSSLYEIEGTAKQCLQTNSSFIFYFTLYEVKIPFLKLSLRSVSLRDWLYHLQERTLITFWLIKE